MKENLKPESNQIQKWLEKLQQESWQLELLVSAFTIFLLIQASSAFGDYLVDLQYQYNLNNSVLTFLFVFMGLLGVAIKALTIFLIVHLLLRGFWIGTIGLRSVQAEVNFDELNYSSFFTKKLKARVISMDQMVTRLDEICSLIFSFAFLVMSMLISFGLYLILFGTIAFSVDALTTSLESIPALALIAGVIGAVLIFTVLLSGIIYLIDYFSLGFFKKYNWLSKAYYPFYRFYGTVTLSVISKSIYYYLISKFSKKRIRFVYLVSLTIYVLSVLLNYEQYQFYPDSSKNNLLNAQVYDDLLDDDDYIITASIESRIISNDFMSLFIRYDASDNENIWSNCPDLEPFRLDGLNWAINFFKVEGGIRVEDGVLDEDMEQPLLDCISSFYVLTLNDSVKLKPRFYWYQHPHKDQRGLFAMIEVDKNAGREQKLHLSKSWVDKDSTRTSDLLTIPFWVK